LDLDQRYDRRSGPGRSHNRRVSLDSPSRKGETRRLGDVRVNVFAQGSVADGIAPVDQTLLKVFGHSLQTGRYRGQLQGARERTLLVQSVLKLIIPDVGTNAPVSSLARPVEVGGDQQAFTQAANLIVDQVQHP